MEKLIITGNGLNVHDVVNVARHGQKVELHPGARNRINECRAMLEKKIVAHEIMYGVNTGIGEFSEIVLDDDQIKDFQVPLSVMRQVSESRLPLRLSGEQCLAGSMSIHTAIPVTGWKLPRHWLIC
jgi:hypothetical protein